MKKILFAASECVPFIKTGGLADVCGALPKTFDHKDWDVRVVIPNYSCIPEKYRSQFEYVTHFYMACGSYIPSKYVGVLQYKLDGVTYYFIDNQEYFNCFVPYGDMRYDIEKFTFFDKAVLSMLPLIGFRPDIIHCHDWQAGLIPVYLKNEFQADSFFWGIRSIMTIHNLKFQGIWDVKTMQGLTGFSSDLFVPDKLEFNKDANMLKGGLVYADYITTVSDTYAQEIQTEYYGEGLNGLLSARHFDMQGIVNGIDYTTYNPQTDSKIYMNYDASNFRKKKYVNKERLQEELGLEVDKKKYMIGLISRLTDQKGLDLINAVMDGLVDEFTQLVVIGTGEPQYENMFRHYAWKYPNRVSANICYSDDLAHKLYAAADAFLMPSRFEPCGLTQMISFRYGTVPIVRETGGLKDTVQAYNEYDNSGDGFSFTNYNADEMLQVINYSKHIFYDRKRQWNQMVDRGMANDFSWNASKFRYEGLYNYLLGEKTMGDTKKENDNIMEFGQAILHADRRNTTIYLLSIIGEIEGHECLPSTSKTTKYEHVLPRLAAIEDDESVNGVLLLLNTMGGDVESGLAIAEMVASLSKPTVSLVLGGSHSIGVPLAVSTDYSFIVPSGTMVIHPVRMSGTVIGAKQTYDYFKQMQDRIAGFVASHCHVSEERMTEMMMNTQMLTKDLGTILVGKQAVSEGIIDAVGGISDAFAKLYQLIGENS